MSNLLTAEQAAARLGIHLKTIYAYVSRGVLTRTLAADGRTSRFDPAEVERLARRGRPRKDARPVGGVDVSLATAITSITAERLFYRGRDVRSLIDLSFESVAEWLWRGERIAQPDWPRGSANVARALQRSLPKASPYTERLAAVCATLACGEPLRVDLRVESVIAHARLLIATLVDSLPGHAAPASSANSIAARLWPRLSPLPPNSARIAVLNSALVLLADHELATSTLAARVAASTRADPFAVALAGIGAVCGPLHGKAAVAAHELLLDAQANASPERAVARLLAADRKLPGFGHPVYRDADPRAVCLHERLAPQLKRQDRALIEDVVRAANASTQIKPNVDFALASLAYAMKMPVGATEALFVIARCAGWIAHALEEYGEAPLRFRARALYVGALPPR